MIISGGPAQIRSTTVGHVTCLHANTHTHIHFDGMFSFQPCLKGQFIVCCVSVRTSYLCKLASLKKVDQHQTSINQPGFAHSYEKKYTLAYLKYLLWE